MINPEVVEQLLENDESPILEFKREWYWVSDETDLSQRWGEFYKDLIGLFNGYLEFVGQDRYLIIGYCEAEKEIFDVNAASISTLRDLRGFRRKVAGRLEALLSYPPLDLEIDIVEIKSKRLLVFKIPSPRRLTQLKAELATKTRVLDPGAVLVRKGQESDSIRLATIEEIRELESQFDSYKKLLDSKAGESQQKKDRSISKTVQLYIEKNSSCSVDVGFPIVVKDWANNIIFELFKISEGLGGSKYFLYLHEHASQGKTNAYLKREKLLTANTPLIILTDSPSIKDKEKRKENIANVFDTNLVFFIDEFGLNFLYGDFIQSFERFNLPVFVESLTDELIDGHNSALKVLDNWYSCPASPLMVIKGYGGIGKTTLVKQFLDNINKTDDSVGLMFIDSNEIVDGLLRVSRAEKKIDDLYDFYAAQSQRAEFVAKSFSKDLLKLSVDNGSLVIVLDGIDEVIAKLGSRFDVSSFIKSIVGSYSDNMEKGKVVVTCRDNFWREFEGSELVREITLMPFNEDLAGEFFTQALEGSRTKVGRAMEMAEKLALKKVSAEASEAVYIPYILDLIVYLLKHEAEFGSEDIRLATPSNILKLTISNDYLVGSVCGREIKKLGNYDIDTQINFLIDFSVSKSGYVSLYDVKTVFERSTSLQITDEFVEKLTGHPLLSCADNKLYFRYDFFYDYFKALYLVRYLLRSDVAGLDAQVLDILNSYTGFDNGFSRSIAIRVPLSENLLLFFMETVEELKQRLTAGVVAEMSSLRGAISGAFSLLLTLKWHQHNSLDTEKCTELLHSVFSTGDCLDGVYLVGLSGSDKAKPLFDFRGKTIRSSYFESYEYFWECPMDEQTRFYSSTFVALEPRMGIKVKSYPSTFDLSCDVSDITNLITQREKEVDDQRSELQASLTQFFKLFHERGNFYPKKQDDVRARIYTGKLLPTLLKNNVVIEYRDPKKAALKQYKIAEAYRPIVKIFEQGGDATLEFERVVSLFM